MNMIANTAASCLLLLLFSAMLCSQTTPAVTPEMRQEANKYYLAQDWEKAVAAYGAIVKIEDANANARFRLGNSLLNLNRNADALLQIEKAFSIAPNPVVALALARVYARVGDKTNAFATLDKSATIGGIAPETLSGDKDFAAWKDDPAFKELVRKNDAAVNPCKASPEFRQFDFWIGEWEAKTPQGQVGGTSSVQLILGQCIIFENWTGTGGSSGKSFNIYDTNDKKWHQTWVDDKGTFTHYIGGLVDGKMVVVADTIISGKKTLAKMTFSKQPNGDVRQFGENSTDDGKTWTTAFDLIYSRKK